MSPAQRHKDFPIGRICMICGRGQTARLGGVAGFAPALRLAGYEWDPKDTLGMAHIPCIQKALKGTGNE